MMSDGLMFDCVRSIPFAVTVICVRAKASVHPLVSYDVVMIVIFKEDLFYSIFHERRKNVIAFCDWH